MIVDNLDTNKPLFCDTETTQLYSSIRLVQLYQEHWEKPQLFDITKVGLFDLYNEIKSLKCIFHNYAYDGACFVNDLNLDENPFKDFEDTLLLAKQAYPLWDSYTLDACFKEVLGFDPYEKIGDKKELQKSFISTKSRNMKTGQLTSQQLNYAAVDVYYLPTLYNAVKGVIFDYTYELDKLVLGHTLRWQKIGLPVQKSKYIEALQKYNEQLQRCNENLPNGFNVNSYKQVQDLLGDKRSDGAGLILHELEGNANATYIKEKRRCLKMLNFLERYNFDRIRGYYNYTASSGRARCQGSGEKDGSDNITQIPRELKNIFGFESDDPRYLVYADYGQLELRTICTLTGEEKMRKILIEGGDLHTLTASDMFGVPASGVSKELRTMAKGCNFGLLYGAGGGTLSTILMQDPKINRVISKEEANELCIKWRSVWSALKAWKQEGEKACGEYGSDKKVIVSTPLGRRVGVNKLTEWLAVQNQGYGAEVAKLAIHYLCRRYPRVKICAFIHDSFTLEAPDLEEAKNLARFLGKCMEDAWYETIKISKYPDLPMPVAIKVGKNWGDLDSDVEPTYALNYEVNYERWEAENAF